MTRPSPSLVHASENVDTTEARRSSAAYLVQQALSEVEFDDVLRAALFQFTPVHIQSRQCLAAAHFLGVDVETVRRWMHGTTTPKAKDVWPLFFVAMLQNLPVQTQRDVMRAITGMCGEQK